MPQPYMIVPALGSDQADEWVRLGVNAQVANRLGEAQGHYQQALRLDPRHALATQNLAIVFAQSNMLNEAMLTIERAALFDGVHGVIQMNRAMMALEADRIDEALEAARKGAELAPEDVNVMTALAMTLTSAGESAEAVRVYNRVLDRQPAHPAAGANACFVQTLTTASPAELLLQRKRWHSANAFKGERQPHDNDRNPGRPLRVGYVGGDFKRHSASFIFGRVLLHHTPAVEMFLYSSLPVDPAADPMTKRYQDAAHLGQNPAPGAVGTEWIGGSRWRDISQMSDEDADRLIRRDRIDVLVDLAAHTNGGRLALFTRRPAPVQVTAWGFAHGTGCPEVDFFLADKVTVPEEERQFYAEKVVDLPCTVTMEPPEEYQLRGTSQPPLRRNGFVTFGSYARYEKMSEGCLRCFADILRQVPDSRMQFKDHAYRRPHAIRRIMRLMEAITPDRLLFSLATSHPDHMLAYQQADLCLDPFPHGGGVVGLECLYMGVPLLTLWGTQPSGRSAASVLTAMGRPEWVARSPEEYVAKAVEWTGRTKELTDARLTLRGELLESPVCKGYVEAVEAAYRGMWKEWCSK